MAVLGKLPPPGNNRGLVGRLVVRVSGRGLVLAPHGTKEEMMERYEET